MVKLVRFWDNEKTIAESQCSVDKSSPFFKGLEL